MDKHTTLVNQFLETLKSDSNNRSIGVTGSVARNEYVSNSDIDLLVITEKDPTKTFIETEEDGIVIEIKFNTYSGFVKKIQEDPVDIYQFLEVKPLHDPEGSFSKLNKYSQEILSAYVPKNKDKTRKWLGSVKIKLESAIIKKDDLLLSFVISNTIWKVVEGLYVVNKMPTPPSSVAFRRVMGLSNLPENFQDLWKNLLLGCLLEKTKSLRILIEYINSRLI